jgi:hypothetical protein
MQYMNLPLAQREAVLDSLNGMAGWLEQIFGGLTADEAAARPDAKTFAPIEQVWHLADLEREGFALRIGRLLQEPEPFLPDFDGDAVAEARHYRSLSLREGLAAFREQRQKNLATLRGVDAGDWNRSGTQQGVGPVSLCDMPVMIAQHDAAHRGEIEAWLSRRLNRSM